MVTVQTVLTERSSGALSAARSYPRRRSATRPEQVARDETVAGVVSFAESLPDGSIVAVSGEEAAVRLTEIVQSDRPGATTRFAYVPTASRLPAAARYYVFLADGSAPPLAGIDRPVRVLPRGEIFR